MGVDLGLGDVLERAAGGQCLLCTAPRGGGLLCRDCVPRPVAGAFAAQVRSVAPRVGEGRKHAILFDAFGQTHHFVLDPDAETPAIIGREARCDLAIVDRSVSRAHAAIIYRREDGGWYLQDRGSRNGTSVDGVALGSAPQRIRHGARVAVASFEFRFMPTTDLRAEQFAALLRACRSAQLSTVSQFQARSIAFAPTDESGGFVTVERQTPSGRQRTPISLSALDFCLLHVLASRYVEMDNFEDEARGWVSSAELLRERLPFGSKSPTSNNLRGAIKRIRDKFRKHGVEGIIESRQNVGYRLMPRFDSITL